jgi:hypothetical protein
MMKATPDDESNHRQRRASVPTLLAGMLEFIYRERNMQMQMLLEGGKAKKKYEKRVMNHSGGPSGIKRSETNE